MSLDTPLLSIQITNHLEQIQWKTLADAPACLQQMLLCLQGYDCTIVYHPGKEMLLAYTLSRYTPLTWNEIALNITIQHVHIGSTHKVSYQELTRADLLLRSLAGTMALMVGLRTPRMFQKPCKPTGTTGIP